MIQRRTDNAFRKMIENKTPGVAVMTSRVQPRMAGILAEQGVASVFLDSDGPGPRKSNIRLDYAKGASEAIHYLHHLGHRRFDAQGVTRRHAEGMSCAAFRHGPLEMVGEHVFVLVFAGDERVAGLNRRLVEDVSATADAAATEGASAPVFRLPAISPFLRPIVEILPVQMLSLALAARDRREAGRFEHASKVTAVAWA